MKSKLIKQLYTFLTPTRIETATVHIETHRIITEASTANKTTVFILDCRILLKLV